MRLSTAHFYRHLCGLVLLALSLSAGATAPLAWPQPPSQLSLDTPYGVLQVSQSEYVYEAQLLLGSEVIRPQIKGMINIPYAFKQQKGQTALISVDTGLGSCPIRYHWITVASGGYTLTPAFGSCSAQIRVRHQGQTLIMETPSRDDPAHIDEYRYDGRKVSLRKRKQLMR
ncbi:hypothetical protein [Alcaligenes sp. SDU_A2]|uniref:hypothetical protein n=1 Tax=Alcaligenes sp. SDU_A2 TaxID=3136634 RepID=UPI002BEADC3F|nr:hypothetical protein [Alcaligenes faecalis]